MTKKALKLLLSIQAKIACRFIGTCALAIAILLIFFSNTTSWIPVITMDAPKIYLLSMGIIYPPIATKLYVSQGLTRKQFFWAYTGAISIISLFLLIPILVSSIYFDSISLPSIIIYFLNMPLFFLIGWTSVVGFQFRKSYTAILGIISAMVIYYAMTTLIKILALSDLAVLGSILLILAGMLLILPRIISQIPLKS